MANQTLEIGGMSCGHCVAAVERALGGLAGVRAVDARVGAATVEYDEAQVSAEALSAAIRAAGYTVLAAR